MRYAVLSDIHSNLEALTAVMDALAQERVDGYLCLGDVLGYGADPSACLAHLEASHAVVVAGNHDQACIGKLDVGWFNDAARAAILWTRDRLSFAELDWLRRLHLTETVEPFTLVHGSLDHPQRFEYLVDLAQVVDTLKVCRALFCLAGHTHVPCLIEYDRVRRRISRMLAGPDELADVEFQREPERLRYLLNPGSVGQPRDGDPRASFAVVDVEKKRLSVRRVAYDIQSAAQKIQQAGLPDFLAQRLSLGR